MNNTTILKENIIELLKQDCTEPTYTDLKSAINEQGIPIC
jgi:hypothetical protein